MTWVISVCVAPSALVRAEPSPASEAKSDYKQLVQQALHEYELGNFSEAKVFFSQAHAIAPNARTLRGLGMCSYELRNYVESIGYFEQALSSDQRPLTVQMNVEVSRLLSQARSFVTRLTIQLQPSDARLRVDSRPVTPAADGSVLLDPGSHELTVEAPNYEPTTHTIRTNGAEVLSLSISLRRAQSRGESVAAGTSDEAPSTASSAPEGAVAEAPGHAADAGGSSQVGPWLLIGSGAAIAIAGGVLLAIALDYKHSVEHPARVGDEAPLYAPYKTRSDMVYPLSFAGIAGLGVGLAGLAGGVIWKVTTAGSGERPSTELQVGLGRVTVHGQF